MSDAEESLLYVNKAIELCSGWSWDESEDYITEVLETADKVRKFCHGASLDKKVTTGKVRKFCHGASLDKKVTTGNPHIPTKATDI